MKGLHLKVNEPVKLDSSIAKLDVDRPKTHLPDFLFSGEILEHEWGDPEFIVPGILPTGLTVLAGKPKVGKSWFGLQIAIEVARGGTVLGNIPVEERGVIYFALEDNQIRLKQRVAQLLGEGEHVPELLKFGVAGALAQGNVIPRLTEALEALPSVELIIIDTLAKVKPPARRTNSYDEDSAALGDLQKLALEWSLSVLVITHTVKGEREDEFDRITGSVGIQGVADTIAVLDRKRGQADDTATLKVIGRDLVDEVQMPLRFSRDTGRWTNNDGAEGTELSDERKAVLNLFDNPLVELTPKQIAEALRKPHDAVKQLLGRMVKAKQLSRVGRGLYTLYSAPFNIRFNGEQVATA